MNYFRWLTLALVLVFVLNLANAQTAHTMLVGVRETESGYVGITANITVHVANGTGNVYLDTMPLTQIDTQVSARLAKEVACEALSLDCTKFDFYYTIRGEYQFVGGPSAGSAMAAATLAALQGVELNSDVMITGTINPSGDIGPVGNVFEKAEAAHAHNAAVFIIPEGQYIEYVQTMKENVNIINYARDHWEMKVIEVPNLIEAYKYMAGYTISEPKISNADIASARYSEIMKVLSKALMSDAGNKVDEARSKLRGSNLTFVYVDELNTIITQGENELNESKSLFQQQQFYSAASIAVRSYIHSYYAYKKIDYYVNGTNESVNNQINSIKADIASFEQMFLKNRQIDSIDDIEIFSVVIDRISESEDVINSAYEAYQDGDIDTALYLTAYAEVRKNTAYNWLTIIDMAKGNLSLYFDHSKIKPLSQERVDLSKVSIAYTQTVAKNSILDDAIEHQTRAENAIIDGKYVFALFESAKARAEANLAMEVRDLTNQTVQSKIYSLEKDAVSAIKDAEEQGLLPILALSYLEFGRTLRTQEPVQSLIYMSYSKEMAKISKDLVSATTSEDILPQQPPSVNRYYEYVVRIDYSQRFYEAIILVVCGALIGAIATLYMHQKGKL